MNKKESPEPGQFSQADPAGAQGDSVMIIRHDGCSCTPAAMDWVADECLDIARRAELAEYTTPRVGLQGEVCWPADEVRPA